MICRARRLVVVGYVRRISSSFRSASACQLRGPRAERARDGWLTTGIRGLGGWPARPRLAARTMPAAAPMSEAATRITPHRASPAWPSWAAAVITLRPVMNQIPSETGIATSASRRAMSAARTAARVVACDRGRQAHPEAGREPDRWGGALEAAGERAREGDRGCGQGQQDGGRSAHPACGRDPACERQVSQPRC